MIIVRGEPLTTSIDAARQLGVSTKTLRQYIQKGIIPPPPEVNFGVRLLRHFPPEYMREAKEALTGYRDHKSIGQK